MKKIDFNSKGFTLIELLVVLAVLAAITGAMAMTINSVLLNFNVGRDRTIALRQVANAGYYMSRDIQMAYSVNTTMPFVTIFGYTGITPEDIQTIQYTLNSGVLMRNDGVSNFMVAQFVDAAHTSIVPSDNNTYIVNVKASYPFPNGISENATFKAQRRVH
jgi:prepilin-type N-terminal cleavage/methylation domain-containing protein